VSRIKTLYIVNHSHTDIGFTDFQDLCFRQHREFMEQALDLCEATADYPEEARYRWTCEVTGTTERYFRQATDAQLQRFRTWHERGAIELAGMQYNLTPLLNVEQMIRSLYPARRLCDDYGVSIRSAMQSDVNGISWLFADLLPAVGIDFLTMSVNPFRGGVPKPMPNAFWWESPSGGKLLTWNGYHYLFGRSIAKLGDWRFVEESLQREIDKLDNDPEYTFDFMYCQSTHPIRVDNGPPDPRMPDFVRDWNASGREPRMVFTTPTEFGEMLRARYGDALLTHRGDWLDWWSDGVASSAYETGMNRETHELLDVAEMLGSWALSNGNELWERERSRHAYEMSTLYDEHTWGGFASIEEPQSRWVKAQWNRKASFAYTASSEAHDLVARGAEHLTQGLGTPGPEGRFNLGDLDPHEAYPAPNDDYVFVVNSLPWSRDVLVEEPELRGGAAPAGVLDCFFPRDVSWGGHRPHTPLLRISGIVPGFGYAFLPMEAQPAADDLRAEELSIENAFYRVRVDPDTGSIAEWIDKSSGHNFAGTYDRFGPGQYVYEWVDSPDQRNSLFIGDFSAEDFGVRLTDTPFRREVASQVTVGSPTIDQGIASISVHIKATGIQYAHCTYSLRTNTKALEVNWLLDKEHVTDVEAVFIAFPFALGEPRFRASINGLPLTPEQDQLSGTVKDWYPVGRWIDVSDEVRGVTVVPLEAPLMHIGGITTGKWATTLEPEGPTLMSWALHNHWMVNFKASQGGEIPLRYRLTTHDGQCDDIAADRFAREQASPLIAIRDLAPTGALSGQFLQVEDGPVQVTHVKPADFGDGLIVRLQNNGATSSRASLSFVDSNPSTVSLTTPDERDIETISLQDGRITVEVGSRQVQSIRVTF
jgi:hypothetical protein